MAEELTSEKSLGQIAFESIGGEMNSLTDWIGAPLECRVFWEKVAAAVESEVEARSNSTALINMLRDENDRLNKTIGSLKIQLNQARADAYGF